MYEGGRIFAGKTKVVSVIGDYWCAASIRINKVGVVKEWPDSFSFWSVSTSSER